MGPTVRPGPTPLLDRLGNRPGLQNGFAQQHATVPRLLRVAFHLADQRRHHGLGTGTLIDHQDQFPAILIQHLVQFAGQEKSHAQVKAEAHGQKNGHGAQRVPEGELKPE